MPVVEVKNLDGKTVGQVELSDEVFAAKINPHLLHETARHYLNARRAGTHKTKEKGEVSGAGRKLWRQKGTGRARIGSIRSPLWRHGGTVHGPTPRDYSYALPKKMILGALRSALTTKLAEEKLTVVDGWKLDSHKTKPFRQVLDRLDGESKDLTMADSLTICMNQPIISGLALAVHKRAHPAMALKASQRTPFFRRRYAIK